MAVVDYFLKLDGIKGESTDKQFKGQVEIESWSWGETNVADRSSRSSGLGAGKVSVQDFHFSKKNDSASPLLFQKCAQGSHIASAVLTCRKAGGDQQPYLEVKLTDVLISSYQIGGAHGEIVPTDQASLSFGKIEFSYKPQDQKGNLGAQVKGSWDITQNKP